MTVSIGELVRVVLLYTMPGASVAENVFIYLLADAAVQDDDLLDDLKTYFLANWLDDWSSLAPSTADCDLLTVDILNANGTVNRNIGETVLGTSGDSAQTGASAAVSGYLQYSTTRVKSLLKKFVPFISEEFIADSLFSAPGLATLILMVLDLNDEITITGGGNLQPGIRSTVDDTFYPVVGAGYTTDVPAYQRRRKPYVGT